MPSGTPPYEKIGAFYLGRHYDLEQDRREQPLVLYDSKDLVTHAVCVGMTGSGKTGLCIGLLEEAALDGIPALIIDPKGDLGNLLLTFPELRAEDFRPWVDRDEAERKGLSLDEFAVQQAELWRSGLASWDQDGERIRRLRARAELSIYTPGSEAGLPISVLASFAAPSEQVSADRELLGDRVANTVTSLLGLVGIEADPVRSREHILLSTLLDCLWSTGTDADLPGLILAIQDPPFDKVGVLDLESFYPAKERFELAMRLNNLLASPGFQGWMEGEPLGPGSLLYTESGRPRLAVLSIAHLSDAERMFFVSLLLNETVSWMRTRPGTTSLRAILYMDEVFGFLPPVARPPSKKPLLTLLKQARAYGLGVVLATQNPADLDYKGLSNTGTWFLGRLQTEQDRDRVLDGLEGLDAKAQGFDRKRLKAILGGLGKRVFLLHNVHEEVPTIFQTRWALSYLRGPLTRKQISRLMEDQRPTQTDSDAPPKKTAAIGSIPQRAAMPGSQPRLSPKIPQVFLPPAEATGSVVYQPGLLGLGQVDYVDRKSRQSVASDAISLHLPLDSRIANTDWSQAEECDVSRSEMRSEPVPGAAWSPIPDPATRVRNYPTWRKELADMLYRTRRLELLVSPSFKIVSEPGESERDFRIRLADVAREERDRQVEKLRKKHAGKAASLEDRIRRAQEKLKREKGQATQAALEAAVSIGTTLMSVLTGRKKLSSTTIRQTSSAARRAGRVSQQRGDVERAEESVEDLKIKLEELQSELTVDLEELEVRLDPQQEKLETRTIRPRRSDIEVQPVLLAWEPTRTSRR